MDEVRFKVGKEGEHVVILDLKPYTRPVVAFLPNKLKPHAPRYLAEICVKALNAENDKYKKRDNRNG